MLPRHCSMVNEQDVWNTYYITYKNQGNPSALTNHASGGSGSGSSDEPSRGFSVVKKRCSDPSEDDCKFRGPNAWEETFEHNDAANGIDNYGPARRLLTENERKSLRASVTAAADRTDICRKYIADLINKVATFEGWSPASPTDSGIEALFDRIWNERFRKLDGINGFGGIYLEKRNTHLGWSGAIYIAVNYDPREPRYWGISRNGLAKQYEAKSIPHLESADIGLSAIHELMHAAFAGGKTATDHDYAAAAAALSGESLPEFEPGEKGVFQASAWWGGHLRQACGMPGYDLKPTNYRLYR